MTYAVPETFGHYPNEYNAYAHYYRYSQAECEGIAEFVEDKKVFDTLKNVLNPGSHREVPTRHLTKDEVIELGDAIKKHGDGLITDFEYNYSNHGDYLICDKGARLINQWEKGESLENVINKIKTAEDTVAFEKIKQKAQDKFGIKITEVFADSNPSKGDCHSISYIHNGEAKKCYLSAPLRGNTEIEVLERLMKEYNCPEEFVNSKGLAILNKEARAKFLK